MGADLRGLQAGPGLARGRRSPTCCSSSSTTTSPRSSSTITPPSRSASATSYAVADEGGGARDLPPVQGHPGLSRAHRRGADGRRVRHVVLPEQAARPRLLLAAVDDVAARARVAGRDRSAAGRRAAVSDPDGAPLLQARASRCAGRSKAIRRTSRSRSSPPAACRTRCTASARASTTPHGTTEFLDLFENDPEALTRHDACRLRHAAAASKAPRSSCGWSCAARCRERIKRLHRTYYLPSMTGIATAIYENDRRTSIDPKADRAARARPLRGNSPAPKSSPAPIRSTSSAA